MEIKALVKQVGVLPTEKEYRVIYSGSIIVREFVRDTTDETWEAGEDIGGHKIVYVDNGKIYKASNLVLAQIGRVIGMTTGAIMTGEVGVVRLIGRLNNPGWGLTANKLYFLTTDGAMSETVPSSGYLQNVGSSTDTDNFAIDIKSPIIRS